MKIVITDKLGQVLYDGSPDLHGDGIIIGSASDCDIQINKIAKGNSPTLISTYLLIIGKIIIFFY